VGQRLKLPLDEQAEREPAARNRMTARPPSPGQLEQSFARVNDETDGNVQLVRRRDGWSVDGHLTEIHPEIGMATEEEPRGDGCQVMAAERPQLLVTNLMVASAMLSCLWQISERGSVPYSEVYLDAIQNAARSRSWFRVSGGAQ
jgi:hypothetical protein